MLNIYKIKKILNTKEKKSLKFVFLYSIINSILEFISIGLLIPIFTTLFSEKNDKINNFISYLPFSDLTFYNTMILLSLCFFFLIFVKNTFSLFFVYKQGKVAFEIRQRLSYDLFSRYLSQKYSYFFLKKSSVILRNIRAPNSFAVLIASIVALILDIVIVLVLISFLAYVSLKATLIILITFGIIIYLFHKYWKKKLYKMGEEKQNIDADITKMISENILSIKEIIIYGKESFFLEIFGKKILTDSKLTFKVEMIQQWPKIVIELLVAALIFMLIFYLSFLGAPKEDFVFVLGSFSIVAIRLMPSASRITQSLQKINFYTPVIDLLYDEFFSEESVMSSVNMQKKAINDNKKFEKLEIKDVNYSYNETKKVFKGDLNLTINRGDFIGIYGKSGSGKSTFVNLITGLLKANTGKIEVGGQNIQKNIKSWQNIIGYVPQNVYLLDNSISNNIAFGEQTGMINKERVNKVAKYSKIDEFVHSLSDKFDTGVGEQGVLVSGGQKQRIGLARAFYKDPEIIILDEVTVGLDKKIEAEILDLILTLKDKKTFIIVSHDKNILKNCSKVYSIETNSIIKKNYE
jgi:ABC-type bacteriocin/lantibiotic exporter with double-glycine peptidase domain